MKTTTLKRQFRLWTIVLILVPSLLVISIYTMEQIKVGKQKSLELLQQRVDSQEFLLNQWLTERMDTVRKLSQLEAFKTLDYPKMTRILYLIQHSNSNFSSLAYINKEGIFQIVTPNRGNHSSPLLGLSYSQEKLPQEEYISNVRIGQYSGVPIINFSFPIYDYDGNFQGLVLGGVRTSMLSPLLSENWVGETGEIRLVDQQGFMLTEPRFASLFRKEGYFTGSSAILNLKLSASALENINLGQSGKTTWIDRRGKKIISAYKSMPERGWTLVGKIDEEEVTAPIYHQLLLMASGTILLLLLFIPFGSLLTNHIKRPLDWLIQQSNLIANEQYEIVESYTSSTKIPKELSILCENFVKMNHQINNTVRVLKENEVNLEHKVYERTIDLSAINTKLAAEIIEHQATNNALINSRDALLVSEKQYKDLFYHMHNGCAYYKVIVDANETPIDLEHIHVNSTYARHANRPASKLIGKSFTEIFPRIHEESFDWLTTLTTVGISGKPAKFTTFSKYQQRWYSVSAYSPTNGYTAIITEDLTHYMNFKKEIDRLDRLNLIGNMAAGLAHEIRNPLTVIKGYLQFFKSKLPRHLYDQFSLILSELQRIETIITVFLSIAKNKPSELEQQNLNDIINSIAPLLLTNALKRSMNIEFKQSANLSTLLLSEKEIKQLLLNLAMNGLNAMKEHGTLTIETKQQGNEVVLSVTDCGCGIPKDIQEKIFDPFFTTNHENTGLGLSVCISIAERHHATIEVSSKENEGTCFTVIFHGQKIPPKKNQPNLLFETW